MKIPELPELVDTDDPTIDARYRALMREHKKMKKKPAIRIPKLPKERFYEDPMIDARYRVLMKEHEKMFKKKKPTAQNLNLQITKQQLEKGVDQIIKDVKKQGYDLTPSEIKMLRKQLKNAVLTAKSTKNTKSMITDDIKKIFDYVDEKCAQMLYTDAKKETKDGLLIAKEGLDYYTIEDTLDFKNFLFQGSRSDAEKERNNINKGIVKRAKRDPKIMKKVMNFTKKFSHFKKNEDYKIDGMEVMKRNHYYYTVEDKNRKFLLLNGSFRDMEVTLYDVFSSKK